MQHKQGESGGQMFMFSPESGIAPDAFVCVVDAFPGIKNQSQAAASGLM